MDNKYELIVCIVNAGVSQNVAAAATKAGAKGGSVVKGRGTANPEAEEFFNISIQPNKEVVLILVTADIKDAVMRSIYKESGLTTDGQGIAFSLPVSRTTFDSLIKE